MQNSRLITIWLMACMYMVGGCKPDGLSPADYVQYVKNPVNGLITRQEHSGIMMEAFYQPPEYVALMQIPPAEIDDSLFRAETESNKPFYHLLFSIGSASAVPIDELLSKKGDADMPFETRKQQMMYQMQNAFLLIIGQDSLPCTFYHTQLSGKLNNAYDFILVFEADSTSVGQPLNDNIALAYRDSIWLQQRFNFLFDKNNINRLPEIKF